MDFSISLQTKTINSRSFDLVGRPCLKIDPHFNDRDILKKNRAAINREIEQGLALRSAAEWEVLLTQEGVPAGRVLSVPEILSHPHLAGRRFVTSFDCSNGEQRVTRGGFTFSGEGMVPLTPAPSLSEHTETLLLQLGYAPQEIQDLRKEGVI